MLTLLQALGLGTLNQSGELNEDGLFPSEKPGLPSAPFSPSRKTSPQGLEDVFAGCRFKNDICDADSGLKKSLAMETFPNIFFFPDFFFQVFLDFWRHF